MKQSQLKAVFVRVDEKYRLTRLVNATIFPTTYKDGIRVGDEITNDEIDAGAQFAHNVGFEITIEENTWQAMLKASE